MGLLRPSIHTSVCPSATLLGCLVCVISISKSFHSFLFKLCIMIFTYWKCAPPILCTFHEYLIILEGCWTDIFLSKMLRWCLVCVICNSNSFNFFIFKLCIMIVHTHIEDVHLSIVHIWLIFSCFDRCWSKTFSIRNSYAVPSLCNLQLQQYSFLFIQILHNDCSHIEAVHLPFCANFMNLSFICRGLEHCIMIVHILEMRTFDFVHISWIFNYF